jgi:hypothetical protein
MHFRFKRKALNFFLNIIKATEINVIKEKFWTKKSIIAINNFAIKNESSFIYPTQNQSYKKK